MAAAGVPLLAVTLLHTSTFAVAALTSSAYLPWLVVGLPAGAWVDRLPARPLMIICDVIAALLYASLPAARLVGTLDHRGGAGGRGAGRNGQRRVRHRLPGAAALPGQRRRPGGRQRPEPARWCIRGRAIGRPRQAALPAAEAIGPATALLVNAANSV